MTHCNMENDLAENRVYTRISADWLQGLTEASDVSIMDLD